MPAQTRPTSRRTHCSASLDKDLKETLVHGIAPDLLGAGDHNCPQVRIDLLALQDLGRDAEVRSIRPLVQEPITT